MISMFKIAVLFVILIQLSQGFIYKCGEEIIVKKGEKRNIKFWVEEGELLKIDALKSKENEKNNQKDYAHESLFNINEQLQEPHPFIAQHIAILNRLSAQELSQSQIQLPKSPSNIYDGIVKYVNNKEKTESSKTLDDKKSILNSGEQSSNLKKGVKSVTSAEIGNSELHHIAADEEILKIIKAKENHQIANGDPVLQLTLNKQEIVNRNKHHSSNAINKNQLKNILNLFQFDTNTEPLKIKHDLKLSNKNVLTETKFEPANHGLPIENNNSTLNSTIEELFNTVSEEILENTTEHKIANNQQLTNNSIKEQHQFSNKSASVNKLKNDPTDLEIKQVKNTTDGQSQQVGGKPVPGNPQISNKTKIGKDKLIEEEKKVLIDQFNKENIHLNKLIDQNHELFEERNNENNNLVITSVDENEETVLELQSSSDKTVNEQELAGTQIEKNKQISEIVKEKEIFINQSDDEIEKISGNPIDLNKHTVDKIIENKNILIGPAATYEQYNYNDEDETTKLDKNQVVDNKQYRITQIVENNELNTDKVSDNEPIYTDKIIYDDPLYVEPLIENKYVNKPNVNEIKNIKINNHPIEENGKFIADSEIQNEKSGNEQIIVDQPLEKYHQINEKSLVEDEEILLVKIVDGNEKITDKLLVENTQLNLKLKNKTAVLTNKTIIKNEQISNKSVNKIEQLIDNPVLENEHLINELLSHKLIQGNDKLIDELVMKNGELSEKPIIENEHLMKEPEIAVERWNEKSITENNKLSEKSVIENEKLLFEKKELSKPPVINQKYFNENPINENEQLSENRDIEHIKKQVIGTELSVDKLAIENKKLYENPVIENEKIVLKNKELNNPPVINQKYLNKYPIKENEQLSENGEIENEHIKKQVIKNEHSVDKLAIENKELTNPPIIIQKYLIENPINKNERLSENQEIENEHIKKQVIRKEHSGDKLVIEKGSLNEKLEIKTKQLNDTIITENDQLNREILSEIAEQLNNKLVIQNEKISKDPGMGDLKVDNDAVIKNKKITENLEIEHEHNVNEKQLKQYEKLVFKEEDLNINSKIKDGQVIEAPIIFSEHFNRETPTKNIGSEQLKEKSVIKNEHLNEKSKIEYIKVNEKILIENNKSNETPKLESDQLRDKTIIIETKKDMIQLIDGNQLSNKEGDENEKQIVKPVINSIQFSSHIPADEKLIVPHIGEKNEKNDIDIRFDGKPFITRQLLKNHTGNYNFTDKPTNESKQIGETIVRKQQLDIKREQVDKELQNQSNIVNQVDEIENILKKEQLFEKQKTNIKAVENMFDEIRVENNPLVYDVKIENKQIIINPTIDVTNFTSLETMFNNSKPINIPNQLKQQIKTLTKPKENEPNTTSDSTNSQLQNNIRKAPEQINHTSIRQLHKQIVDVKPELFETRNIINQISKDGDRNHESISDINFDLLRDIKNSLTTKIINSPIKKEMSNKVKEQIMLPNLLLETITKDAFNISNSTESFTEIINLKSNLTNEINDLNITEHPNVFPHDVKILNQVNLSKNKIDSDTDIKNTDNKSDIPTILIDDMSYIKDIVNILEEGKKSSLFTNENFSTDDNKKDYSKIQTINSKVISTNLNLQNVNNEDFSEMSLVSNEKKQINTKEKIGIKANTLKEIKKSNFTPQSQIGYPKESTSTRIDGDQNISKNTVKLQMIPYDILNMNTLNNNINENKSSVVIKENGVKVSISNPAANLLNNYTHITDKLFDQELHINISSDKNYTENPIALITTSSIAKLPEITMISEAALDDGINITKLELISSSDEVPQMEFSAESKTDEETYIVSNKTEEQESDLDRVKDLLNVNKLEDEEFTSLLKGTKKTNLVNTDDSAPIYNRFDNFGIYETSPTEIDLDQEETTSVTGLVNNNSTNAVKLESSVDPSDITVILPNINSNKNMKETHFDDTSNQFKNTNEYTNVHGIMEDIFNTPLSELENEFDIPLVSNANKDFIHDLIGNAEETTTNSEFYPDVNDDTNSISDLIGFNRPSSLENQESVIDMIKDFIFSIPKYSNTKNIDIASEHSQNNEKLNKVHLDDNSFQKHHSLTDIKNNLEISLSSKDKIEYDEEQYPMQKPPNILQKRKGPEDKFYFDLKDIHSRRDDSPTHYGGNNPFFIKLPGSPNTVPVFLQYEPVKVNYVPAEKLWKSNINKDLLSNKLNKTKNSIVEKTHDNNFSQPIAPKLRIDELDPFFIMDSPNLSNNNYKEHAHKNNPTEEMVIDMKGTLSVDSDSNLVAKINPYKNEILYPGKSSDVEAYSSIDTQSLTNLVFQMGPKLATPPTREPNPQYTPFPLTTNPPITTTKMYSERTKLPSDTDVTTNSYIGTPSVEYSPVPFISFDERLDSNESQNYNNDNIMNEKKIVSRERLNYRSPQRSALRKTNDDYSSAIKLATQEDFDVVALANFLHQNQKGWIDEKPLALSTPESLERSSWDNFKYVAEADDTLEPTKDSSPWLTTVNDSKNYHAFYSPEDIPGIDPALFSYRKSAPSLRQSRGIDIESLKTYINNLPLPLREAILSSSSKYRSRRHVFLGEKIACQWNIKSDPKLYLVVTFNNLSAEYSVNCQGAYIEVERENNGFEARWCGNRVSMNADRSHVIFAKSHIRITVFDNGDEMKELPTGFEADIEAIDLSNSNEYTRFAMSNARSHMRKLKLIGTA